MIAGRKSELREFACQISSESECLPTNKHFQVLPTMAREMTLLTAAILFNVSATSFPFEMYKSVPVIEAAIQ